MFRGKNAVVTGSTSGIGLGIASALAASGANIMLNGFGDRTAIEKLRTRLSSDHGVRVAYSAADMSEPAQIGAVAAFLCSEAAAQVRGIALPVDGGWTAQ